ncbi:MAG: hypothetical protein J6B67_00355 [Oscillospiraceae bacterium]|nr:hypothetical protein [Oscillospiraceae bacterium]
MIDYDFYVNSYMGTAIPETAFAGAAVRAAQALSQIRRQYQVRGCDPVSEKMALCAMAEELYANRRPGISAATVGSVSVRYDSAGGRQGRLLEKARIYLDIYRGASPWSAR